MTILEINVAHCMLCLSVLFIALKLYKGLEKKSFIQIRINHEIKSHLWLEHEITHKDRKLLN